MSDEFKTNTAYENREIKIATQGDPQLGPLKMLPGTWANIRPDDRDGDSPFKGKGNSPFDGRGWNLIALPFFESGQRRNYRLLMNQYNEVLSFKFIDDKVPNRGITRDANGNVSNADQLVAALDYEQMIAQIRAKDSAGSDLAGPDDLPIHHEPGFFLHMKEQQINGFDIGRLATIPHGDAATALGRSRTFDGPPSIPHLAGFPEGVAGNIADAVNRATDPGDYLHPYQMFTADPFKGVIPDTVPFPGFSPADANHLLSIGLPPNVVRTTELPLDTDVMEAGIVNIPFIVRQANAAVMRSTFWIMELDEMDANGNPRLVLAYSQFIFLDFFPRFDGRPGLIRWPHISINMMEKIEDPNVEQTESPTYLAAKYTGTSIA